MALGNAGRRRLRSLADRSLRPARRLDGVPGAAIRGTRTDPSRDPAALIFAPVIKVLIRLALSRTREYDADLGAAEFTGDPEALASALRRMEQYRGNVLEQILTPGRRVPDPSLLRTHPRTEDRIRRLRELTPASRTRRRLPGTSLPADLRGAEHGRPRWHVTGIWR